MADLAAELKRILLEPLREMVKAELRRFVAKPEVPNPWIRHGTIPAGYTTGMPTVQFDGDTAASGRRYPYVSSYTPTANDRVVLVRSGSTWLVLGKIIAS